MVTLVYTRDVVFLIFVKEATPVSLTKLSCGWSTWRFSRMLSSHSTENWVKWMLFGGRFCSFLLFSACSTGIINIGHLGTVHKHRISGPYSWVQNWNLHADNILKGLVLTLELEKRSSSACFWQSVTFCACVYLWYTRKSFPGRLDWAFLLIERGKMEYDWASPVASANPIWTQV